MSSDPNNKPKLLVLIWLKQWAAVRTNFLLITVPLQWFLIPLDVSLVILTIQGHWNNQKWNIWLTWIWSLPLEFGLGNLQLWTLVWLYQVGQCLEYHNLQKNSYCPNCLLNSLWYLYLCQKWADKKWKRGKWRICSNTSVPSSLMLWNPVLQVLPKQFAEEEVVWTRFLEFCTLPLETSFGSVGKNKS